MIDVRLQFGDMQPSDWPAVAAIFKEGIDTGHATFQQDLPTWEEWNHAHLAVCRITIKINDELAGWAALTPVSGRSVYAGVAEVSVYVGKRFRARSVGKRLLEKLVAESEAASFWTLQAGIFPENEASVAIHQQQGFRIVGRRERIGKMGNIWRDTLLLERRSEVVGL